MNDHDLRDLFAAPGELEPLDPATIIAGAQRRRRRRDLFARAVGAVAVLAVAVGSLLAVNQSDAGRPAKPPVAGVTSTPSKQATTPRPPAAPSKGPKLTKAACLAAYEMSRPAAPGAKANVIGTIEASEGRLMVIADSKYFGVCENSFGLDVSAREAHRVQRPSTSDNAAFAVANDGLDDAQGKTHEFYWAGGLLPPGVAGVRYVFLDGKSVDANVFGQYWAVRYFSSTLRVIGQASPGQVEVRLLRADGSVVRQFKLVNGVQTCAQISHGC